jgi:pre-mRNA-splicing factor ATP-dependent RNA helicase DHX15/PRP43
MDVAPHYYDLSNFPAGDTKRALERLENKKERDRSEKF